MLGLLLVSLLSLQVMAQDNRPGRQGRGNGGPQSFEQFMAARISFLVQEMKLNEADSAQFVVVYNEMNKAKGDLFRKYSGRRDVYRKLHHGEAVDNAALLQVVRNNAQLQVEDAQLEQTYLEKFAKILTPRQLFDYKEAEWKFKNNMMQRPRNRKQ